MKRLLNTLYVTSANRYLSLDGENVVVLEDREEIGQVPLHNLQSIVTFGYTGASPALMGDVPEKYRPHIYVRTREISGESDRGSERECYLKESSSIVSARTRRRVSVLHEILFSEKYTMQGGF